jgi:anti-sigma factor RsiW
MGCEEIRRRLDACVDGEMDPGEAAALGRHLRTCAACSAEALDRVQLKRSVAAAGRRYAPGADLRARIMRSTPQPRRQVRWGWQVLAVPTALVLIVSLATGLYLGRAHARRERLMSEIADLHVGALAASRLVDVVSSDRHTVKPWFQGKIPFSFDLPDLAGSPFTLVGGRLASFAQTPAAHLIFRLRQHLISVFIFQDAAAETSSVPAGSSRAVSFSMDTWTQDGLRYVVIGDAGAADIEALARLMRAGR